MKEIQLTQGYVTIVDDEDYDFLMQWKWHVLIGTKIYAMRNSDPAYGKRKHILMHRVLNNTPQGFDTDHINGNSLDNRRCNLRSATRAQNMWNRAPNKKSKSKYKGVSWHSQHKKWCVSIQVHKKRYHIGLFPEDKELDAAKAYADRAEMVFKEFNREAYYGRP